MAVRKVSNRGRRNTIGRFPSLKLKRMVQYESLIELEYIHLLEYDPSVSWYEEQPLEIPYEFDGKTHCYIPDFHTLVNGQHWLIECKPAKFVRTDETQRKVTAAEQWSPKNGYCYCVVTEKEIRAGYRLQNVKFLLDHGRHNIGYEIRATIMRVLYMVTESITVGDLVAKVEPEQREQALIAIYHMAFHHVAEINVDAAPISADSIVSLHR